MLKSRQITPEEDETTKLMTTGTLEEQGDTLIFSYEDTEATGFAGSTTKVTVTGNRIVTILRSGTASSNLVLEPKKKHFCLYRTPYGTMTIGVLGKYVQIEKTEDRGTLNLAYHLDINGTYVSDNVLELCWKPQRAGADTTQPD